MSLDRRDFLAAGVAAGIGAAALSRTRELAAQAPEPFRAPPMERVRIGFVGV